MLSDHCLLSVLEMAGGGRTAKVIRINVAFDWTLALITLTVYLKLHKNIYSSSQRYSDRFFCWVHQLTNVALCLSETRWGLGF